MRHTRIAFTEDVAVRFMGYQWNVLRVGDANDIVVIFTDGRKLKAKVIGKDAKVDVAVAGVAGI